MLESGVKQVNGILYTDLFSFDCSGIYKLIDTVTNPFLESTSTVQCKFFCSKKQRLTPDWVSTKAASNPKIAIPTL